MSEQHTIKPWYREPWPWYLMLGPAVAIVACAITITLAFKHFADEPIYDGGVKRGLVVEKPAAAPAPQRP